MTVKGLPGSFLEVVETEFFFQLLVGGKKESTDPRLSQARQPPAAPMRCQ